MKHLLMLMLVMLATTANARRMVDVLAHRVAEVVSIGDAQFGADAPRISFQPTFVSYNDLCNPSFTGRSFTTLGTPVDINDIPPRPAIACSSYSADSVSIAEVFGKATHIEGDNDRVTLRFMQNTQVLMTVRLLN